MKNKRYKGKNIDTLGINSEFMKTLIKNDNTFHGELNLPKPQNNAEIAMLSKFLFGIELSVRFEYCYDKITEGILKANGPYPNSEVIKLSRFLKLYRIDPNKKDYITKGDRKMEFLYLRYFCNQEHCSYYDYEFNMEVFQSSYELDNYFWRHCIGKVSCGGIASHSYGQVSVTSFKQYERVLNIFNNADESVRRKFKSKIDKLIAKNKKYEEKIKT